MKKSVISVVLSLCMVLAYSPVTAFADTSSADGATDQAGQVATSQASTQSDIPTPTSTDLVAEQSAPDPASTEPIPVTITIGATGQADEAGAQINLPVDDSGALLTSGEGWTYDSETGTLVLDAGYAFTLVGESCTCTVENDGTIKDGAFKGDVTNAKDAVIEGGTFKGAVVNAEGATIEGGTFEGTLDNTAGGTVETGDAVSYGITNTLENLTSDDDASTFTSGSDYTETLTTAEGYTLPATITVTLNGQEAVSSDDPSVADGTATADYTWDAATGVLTIPAATGDKLGPIAVTAAAATPALQTQTLTPQADAVTIDLSTCTATLSLYYDGYKYNGVYTAYSGSYILTGSSRQLISINNKKGSTPLNVTFKDATISRGDTCLNVNGDTNLTFQGTDSFTSDFGQFDNFAVLYIGSGTTTINNEGNLNVSVSSSSGTAIGAGFKHSMGSIVINGTGGSVLTATAGSSGGAGIGCPGGDAANTVGDITINSGAVIATGGKYSPGIGANSGTSASGRCVVTINGGAITATGGDYAAGIGSGDSTANPTNIYINGGTIVKAQGGYGAAGIGGGYKESDTATVLMSGGTVQEARGGTYAAGIGSGSQSSIGKVDISGSSTVYAYAGEGGAGIGGGSNSGGTVSISGSANCTAEGGKYGAGIGAGDEASSTVTIEGACTVRATGGYKGAGIGGGCDSTGTVTVSGGYITTTGGDYAPGIGDADDGTGGIVRISGGTIDATGGYHDPGIGNYNGDSASTIVITGGNIKATPGNDKPEAIHPFPTDGNGNRVYITQMQVSDLLQSAGGHITSIAYTQGGASLSYNMTDVSCLDSNKVYAWLPAGNTNTATLTAEDDAYHYTLTSVVPGGENWFIMSQKTDPTADLFLFTVDNTTYAGGNEPAVAYSDKGHTVTVETYPSVTDMGTLTLIFKDHTTGQQVQGTPSEPGVYDIYVRNTGTLTYNAATTRIGSLTITKADSSENPVTATGYKGVYDGQYHTISASAEQSGSTLYYSTSNPYGGTIEVDWSTTVPSYWRTTLDGSGNVGTETVYVKATNPHYKDSYGSADVKIGKRPLTITASSATLTYNGQKQSIFGGTYQPAADGDDLVHDPTTMPYVCAGTDVGTYEGHLTGDMAVKAAATKAHAGAVVGTDVTDCYDIRLVTGKLTIVQANGAENPITAAPVSVTYDGKEHTITSPTTKETSTFYYSTDTGNEKTWSTTSPKWTNTGTYTVYIKAVSKNFKDSFGSATLTINPAPLTVTADDKTKQLNTVDPEYTFTATGLVNSESQDFVKCSFSRVAGERAGTYTITPTGDKLQSNYTITYKTGTLTISKDPGIVNTVTVSDYSGVYDGNEHTVTATASQAGSTFYYSTDAGDTKTWSSTAPVWKDVELDAQGASVVHTVCVKAVNPGCSDAFGSATVTVTAAPITITAASNGKVYDGTALTDSGYSLTGSFAPGEGLASVSVSGSQTHGGSSANTVTDYTLASGTKATNYSITTVPGTLTVSKTTGNAVTVSGFSGTYDAAAHGITATPKVTEGTTLYYSKTGGASATDWSTTAPAWTNVASAQTVYVKATSSDYEDVYGQATVTITARNVIVAADDKTKTHGDADPAFTATVAGTLGSDTVAYTFNRAAGEDVGTYSITPIGDKVQGNYKVVFVPGTLTIEKGTTEHNTVTATAYSGIYDGSAHTITASATQTGSTLYYSTDYNATMKTGTWSTTAPTWKDVTSAQTVYVKATNPNYDDAYGQATVTITAKPVTVKANDKSKVYGETDPSLDATVSGLIGSDTLVYVVNRAPGDDVGTYVITPSGAETQGNYTITYAIGMFTIAAGGQNTVTATSYSGIYDGTAHGVTVSASQTGSTFYYSTDAGDTKTWSETAPVLTDVGSETVYVKATKTGFTDTAVASATITVTARPLALTGETASKVYSGSTQTLSNITSDGLIDGQTLTEPTYAATGTDVGTYQGAFSGTAKVMSGTTDVTSDYAITTTAGTLTITKAASSQNAVTATAYSGTYDGASHGITVSAAQAGSTLYYSGTGGAGATDWSTTAPARTSVGTQTVYVKAVNPDYEDSFGEADITIAAAPVTVTADDASKTYGETDQTLTASVSGLVNGEATSVLTYDVTRASGDEVGTYAITPTGKADQGNYTVTYQTGTFTIAKAPASQNAVAATAYLGTYDADGHTIKASAAQTGSTLSYSTTDPQGGAATVTWTNAPQKYTEVGTHTVYVKATNPNYGDSYGQATVTITRKSLTLTGESANRTYTGDAQTITGITPDGLISGQTISGLTYAASGAEVGIYQGVFSGTPRVMSGSTDVTGDYSITTKAGTLTIAKGSADENKVTATAYDAAYDGTAHTITASAAKTGSTLYYSRTGGEGANDWSTDISKVSFTDVTEDASGTMSPQTVYVKATNPSYDDAYGQATVSITPAEVTVAADDADKMYGETDPTLTASVSGLVNGEATSVLTYSVTRVAGENVGTYLITPSGEESQGNYIVTYEKAGFNIDAASILADVAIAPQTYTGQALTPGATVSYVDDNGKTVILTPGTDYDISDYTDNKNVGTATCTVTLKGNYEGLTMTHFLINPATVAAPIYVSTFTYNGQLRTSMQPSTSTFYTVSGQTSATDAGTYTETAALTDKTNTTWADGTSADKTIVWKITPAPVTVTAGDAFKTFGSVDPRLSATVTGTQGSDTIDFTLARATGENAGTYAIAASGAATQGNYTVTYVPATFTIKPADASSATVDPVAAQIHTGSALKPPLVVAFENKVLTENTDYTVTYENNVDVGTARYLVNFIGNYISTKALTGTFLIAAEDASSATVDPVTSQAYTGSEIKPALTVKLGSKTLTPGTDYTVSYNHNTNVGDADYTITFSSYYGSITKDGTFTITPADASSATVSGINPTYTYTGSAIAPEPTVKLGDKTLVAGTDYDVTYSSNTDPGQASYSITFKGNYTGTKSGTFTIEPLYGTSFDDETSSGVAQVGAGLTDVLDEAIAAAPSGAKTIIVDLTVDDASASGTPALAIKALSSASGLTFDDFYDVALTKTVDGTTTDIGSTNDVLIGITYPFDFSGKDTVRVFAYHGSQAYELTGTPNTDGEYVVLDRDANTVTVYAKRYSTYAIGYTTTAVNPGSGGASGNAKAAATVLPKTGDTAAPWAGCILALALIAVGVVVVAIRRRKRRLDSWN